MAAPSELDVIIAELVMWGGGWLGAVVVEVETEAKTGAIPAVSVVGSDT